MVFVSTRQFTSNKWGTKTPVMMRDPELGAVRLRVYGTYSMRVGDAEAFVRELVGANSSFTIAQITDQVRDLVVSRFSELLGEKAIPVLELASNYRELGDMASVKLQPELARLGVELAQLVVESIALPDEVAATLDQRTRIALIGDVSAYAQLQAADAIRDSARNPGGGGAGVGIGVGLAMANKIAGAASQALQPAARRRRWVHRRFLRLSRSSWRRMASRSVRSIALRSSSASAAASCARTRSCGATAWRTGHRRRKGSGAGRRAGGSVRRNRGDYECASQQRRFQPRAQDRGRPMPEFQQFWPNWSTSRRRKASG